jgi:hypothetical protein
MGGGWASARGGKAKGDMQVEARVEEVKEVMSESCPKAHHIWCRLECVRRVSIRFPCFLWEYFLYSQMIELSFPR